MQPEEVVTSLVSSSEEQNGFTCCPPLCFLILPSQPGEKGGLLPRTARLNHAQKLRSLQALLYPFLPLRTVHLKAIIIEKRSQLSTTSCTIFIP